MSDTDERHDSDGTADGQARAPDDREEAMREALRQVVDPEMQIDVVALGLIRGISIGANGTAITMILTTPFCPYGDYLIQQVVDAARAVAPGEVQVTMGSETWTPAMMEDADLAEWGLL